jgi:hypothetical protein
LIDFGAVKEINTLLIQQSKLFSATWTIGTPGYCLMNKQKVIQNYLMMSML